MIQKMAIFILAPLVTLSIASYFINQIFPVVPALSYLSCYKHFDFKKNEGCGLKFTNQIMFVVLNWFEIAGLSVLFWIIRNIQNELNIKKEVQSVLIFWSTFSVLYFIFQLIWSKLDEKNIKEKEHRRILSYLIFGAIQLRNLSALFATTLFSIYTVVRHPEKSYPKTIEGKLEALDFDTMLTSPISFQSFFEFIEEYQSFYKPYMEVYMLTKLY